MRALSFSLVMLSSPVWADVPGFENDYPSLFATHAGRVQQATPGTRILEMPGPVIVYEETAANGTTRYRAEDQSGLGAAGCAFDALINATVIAGLCEDALDATETAQLDAMTRAMARFVGANTTPPVPVAEVEPRLHAAIRDRAARIRVSCMQDGGEGFKALLRPGGIAAVKRVLRQDRLPVMHPCD